MTLSHESESLSVKKLARQSFFDHYKQFTQLIESVDNILSGSSSKSLEGNEIRKSVMILDHITKDLQGIGTENGTTPLEQETHAQGILQRWNRNNRINQNKSDSELEDVYEALSKILMLDKQIADYGIISLDTSIFQKKKKESGIISSGFGGQFEQPTTAQKYTLFCEVFQNMTFPEGEKLSLQDCMIYEEQLEGQGRMRKTPYKIVYIPAPIMQAWCISDEMGQAIYIYDGHPLLETIIHDMKGGNAEQNSEKLVWKQNSEGMKHNILSILEHGLEKPPIDSGINKPGLEGRENVPSEDMKLKLWAQKALMEARDFLDSIGMVYLGNGKWDLHEMKGERAWKSNIGGKKLGSFPSSGWNKSQKIGSESGTLFNPNEIAKMLVSLGYTKDDIIEKLADPLEWKEQMDKEAYKKTARTELEKNEYKYFLDSIGMIYLGDGKWNLHEMKGVKACKNDIGGKKLGNFPSAGWNKIQKIGNELGTLVNLNEVAKMLVSLGYKQEDILEKASDPLEWSKEMDVEIYKKTARTELEKEEHKIFLDSIGMKFLGNGKWDLQDMKGERAWKNDIGGKKPKNFPSSSWNKEQKIGSESGTLRNPNRIAKMLVSLGYKQEDILEKASDPLEWSKEMDVEIYKKTVRTELEKEEHKIFLDSIGMKFLGDGKWNLNEIKHSGKWKVNIGGKKRLGNFPSSSWNKEQKIGSESGTLLNPNDIAKMLVSLGYKEEDISCKETKKSEL